MSRRSARSPSAARRCWSPSIVAPPVSSRSRKRARLGLDVVVIDHHQADEVLAAGGRDRQSEPARRSFRPRPSRRGRARLHDRGRASIGELRRARLSGPPRGPSPICWTCSTIVALGTVADVVPLIGLNRAFVAKGLIALRRRERVGPDQPDGRGAALRPARGRGISAFCSGPRINAGGRIGRADLGARLLLRDDPIEAAAMAAELDRLNRERQAIELADCRRKPRRRPRRRSASRRRARSW